jgi:preprotein translocase subunit SecA
MIASIGEEAVEAVFKLEAAKQERFKGVFSSVSQQLLHPELSKFEKPEEEKVPVKPVQSSHPKVGRNDPCPCGAKDPVTGNPIKYKKCHGK